MPTPRLTDEQRELRRAEEWQDREFWEQTQAKQRAHELEVLELKKEQALGIARVRANGIKGIRRTAVWAVVILALFNRPVPPSIADLLDK